MTKTSTVVPAADSPLDETLLLTVADVAEQLRMKPWAVNQLCASGAIPSVWIGNKLRRIKPDDLRAYVASLPDVRPEPKSA